MYYVYVLRSIKDGKQYVGVTAQHLTQKLTEHNQGSTRWTRAHRPFELLRSEEFLSKTLAIKREKFLKSGNGRKVLDNYLKKV